MLQQELAMLSDEVLRRLTVEELATVIRGLAAINTQLGSKSFDTQNFIVLDRVTVRDTDNHDSPNQIDLRQAVDYAFQIQNGTDQVLNFRVIGSIDNASDVATLGDPFPVAANSRETLSVPKDLWLPFVGGRATFTTAPTSGTVTIILSRRERTWVQ